MADADRAAELQGLQAGGERRGSDASQTGDCCMEAVWQQFVALGANRIEACSKGSREKWEKARGRCQEKKKEEGIVKVNKEQGKTCQQLVFPAQGGFNEGTPASLVELHLPRFRGAHGEGGGAGNSGAANDRKRTSSSSPSRLPMEEDALLVEL